MKVPGLHNDPLPPSSKRVWRLKKYTKSNDEIQQEQQQYADLEFSPKKSSRRPKTKPGEAQEFVFVDLSPTKKQASSLHSKRGLQHSYSLSDIGNASHHQLNNPVIAPKVSQPVTMDGTGSKDKNRKGLSRLFRLSTGPQQLEDSPNLDTFSSRTNNPSPPSSIASPVQYSRPSQSLQPSPSIPEFPHYPTPPHSAHSQHNNNNINPSPQIPPLKRTLTPLVMTISSDGRAVLQPSSVSSSTSDLFSLNPSPSHRSPSPKRAESPVDYESGDDNDAIRAFERAVRRKRANTGSSMNSLCRNTLTRAQSASSITSVTALRSRASPHRASILRQGTPVDQRANEFVGGGYFDDVSREPRRPTHLRQQKSISTLGPALGMESDFDFEFGLSTLNNIDDDDENKAETENEDLAEFFDFSAFGDTANEFVASFPN